MYTRVSACIYVYVHACVNVHVSMDACMDAYMHAHACAACMHRHACVCMHACMHAARWRLSTKWSVDVTDILVILCFGYIALDVILVICFGYIAVDVTDILVICFGYIASARTRHSEQLLPFSSFCFTPSTYPFYRDGPVISYL